jgi:hypothetical protein
VLRTVWLTASIALLAGACDGNPPAQVQRRDQRLPDLPWYKLDINSRLDGVPDSADGSRIDLPRDRGADQRKDGYLPPPAKCGGSSKLRLQEVATGQPDYLAVTNKGTSSVDLKGYRLELTGIDLELYTFQAGQIVSAGKTLYVFEHATGAAGDLSIGANIPFYDSADANAVALWDPAGYLIDYVAIGDAVIGLPYGASAAAIPWPASFDPKAESFQRTATAGACPSFKASDWSVKPITRK